MHVPCPISICAAPISAVVKTSFCSQKLGLSLFLVHMEMIIRHGPQNRPVSCRSGFVMNFENHGDAVESGLPVRDLVRKKVVVGAL